jgi:hypothetical protein
MENKLEIEMNLLKAEIESKQNELTRLEEINRKENKIPKIIERVGKYYKYQNEYVDEWWTVFIYIKSFNIETLTYKVEMIENTPSEYKLSLTILPHYISKDEYYGIVEISKERFNIQKELFLNQLNEI